jgi:hypothetical protein
MELLMTATLLMVISAVVGKLTVATGRVWQELRGEQLVMDDLQQQMERLTLLDVAQCQEALADLQPSIEVRELFEDAEIQGEISVVEVPGEAVAKVQQKLRLSLTWTRRGEKAEKRLVGWLATLADRDMRSTNSAIGGDQ